MRWIGLISMPGSSPLNLIKWSRGCLQIFGQYRGLPETRSCQGDGRGSWCETGKRKKTHDKVLFVGEHNIHCVDIISAIGLIYNEFVFLEGNIKEVSKEGQCERVQWEAQNEYMGGSSDSRFQGRADPIADLSKVIHPCFPNG
jgi:hypothetical protein